MSDRAAGQARALAAIERSVAAQMKLIEGILDLACISTAGLRLDRQAVDPASLIKAAIEGIRRAAEQRSIRLEAAFDGPTFRVNSGDSIGGSTFVSGIFQDEPTIHVLNAMGIDASSVGNHEFDEGVEELMRIVNGGNHPELGGFDNEPYPGTNFPYLAANVVWKDSGEPILPPYVVQQYKGVCFAQGHPQVMMTTVGPGWQHCLSRSIEW